MEQTLERITEWLPQLAAAIALLLAAWLIAVIVRFVVRKSLQRLRVDERWGDGGEGTEAPSMTGTLSEGAYWIVFLLFVPFILDTLGLRSLLAPFSEMANGFLAYLPNLVGAGLILMVGWFIARFVRRVSTKLLASVGVDRFSERIGVDKNMGEFKLSSLLGLIAYVLILIPVAIAALNALQIEAITEPASQMLNDILVALPAVFGAAVIVTIAYAVGKVVNGIVTQVLAAIGFDRLFERTGLWKPATAEGSWAAGSESGEMTETAETGATEAMASTSTNPSKVVGTLAFIGVILVGVTAALQMMQFTTLQNMLAEFMVFAGQILMGLAIFVVGLLLANWAARMIESSDTRNSHLLAQLARAAVLILAGAIALRQMGLANEIITLAFAFIVGAVAVAAGIAFGVGGRDVASEMLSDWRRKMESEEGPPTPAE